MHLDEGVNRILFFKYIAENVGVKYSEGAVKSGVLLIENALNVIDKKLEQTHFIAGDNLTIADICLLSTIDPIDVIDIDILNYKNLYKWQVKMKNKNFYLKTHKSYKQAVDSYFKNIA